MVPYSCARARTVASEVFTEAQSFADCKLHIRTRLLSFGLQQFFDKPAGFLPCSHQCALISSIKVTLFFVTLLALEYLQLQRR